MEAAIVVYSILGIYRGRNGKENGSYYIVYYVECICRAPARAQTSHPLTQEFPIISTM